MNNRNPKEIVKRECVVKKLKPLQQILNEHMIEYEYSDIKDFERRTEWNEKEYRINVGRTDCIFIVQSMFHLFGKEIMVWKEDSKWLDIWSNEKWSFLENWFVSDELPDELFEI